MKTIGKIFSLLLLAFGFLFILGAFSPDGQTSWLLSGSIMFILGAVLFWLSSRKPAEVKAPIINTTLKVDLPADVDIERFQCTDCGAQLSMDDTKLAAGSLMVDCPYCGAAYQLTEKPKW